MDKTEELIKENEELKKELKSTVEKNNRLYSLNEMEIKVNNQHVEDYKKLEKENDELKERIAIQKTEFEEEIENKSNELFELIRELAGRKMAQEVDKKNFEPIMKKYKNMEAKLEKIKEECKNAPMCDTEFSLRILEIIGEE